MKILSSDLYWNMALPAWALLLALCLPAQAASDFDLKTRTGHPGTPAEYSWHSEDKVLTVEDGADITITGAVTDGTRIEVAAGAKATITLDGVSITGIAGSSLSALRQLSRRLEGHPHVNQSALALNAGANVGLHIRGTNTLTAGDCPSNTDASNSCAGIGVPSSGLWTQRRYVPAAVIGTTLSIDGTGTLTATGGIYGAGIGGSGYRSSSNGSGTITINGGTVIANGGDLSAGIGGGGVPAGIYGSGGMITISAGTVIANGGRNGAGIGGGSVSPGGTIIISSGTVTATGGLASAGIGGGRGGASGDVTITGDANVTVTGGDGGGAGIGSGSGIITPGIADTDSRQYLNSGLFTVAIGTIKIDTTGTVNATGGSGADGSGTGANIGQGGSDRGMRTATVGAGIKSFSNHPNPASASVPVGDTASFTCDASPMAGVAPLTFTWLLQFSGSAAAPAQWVPTTVRESTSAVFILPNVTPDMAGQYRCVVLATNLPRGSGDSDDTDVKKNAPASHSIRYVSRAATLTVTAEK